MTLFKAIVPYTRYLAVLVIAIGFGAILDRENSEHFRVNQRLALIEANNEFQSALEREINEKILITEGVMAAFAAQPDMSSPDFVRVASQLVRNADDVINVAAAPDLVIEYVYPYAPNAAAVGLDIRQRPDLMTAVHRAIQTGETTIDGPFDLVQGGRGFITRSAVMEYYTGGFENRFWGVVSLVIDADGLFRTAGLGADDAEVAHVVQNAQGQILSGSSNVLFMDPVSTSVVSPGISWTLSMVPADGWVITPPNRTSLWATVLGLLAAVMLLMRVFQWIVDRKDAAETQLHEAIEAIDDGFALYDSSSRLVMCNQKYKKLYPTTADLMEPGARFEDILRRGVETGQYLEAMGREEDWIRERVLAQQSPGQMIETQLSDGRWLRMVERRTASGSVAGFRVDITELKEALAKSEAANAAKSEFLNTVSHELRTPLTVVLGYNAFLRHPDSLPSFKKTLNSLKTNDTKGALEDIERFKADLEKFSKQIEVSGQQLMALISSILDLSAIEEGTLNLDPDCLELEPIILEVVEQFQLEADKKGVEIEVDNQAAEILADPQRLRQVLLNLIGNAVKFTDEGKVTVRTNSELGRTWIEVEDTGCGIPPEHLEMIFERFGQVDASSSRKHGGIGLGLPIAKHLAELHGGAISVTSTEGQGSIFRVEFNAPVPAQGAVAG
ncbi:hypothetical protein E2K80_14545 [Rhodophyticola sp. CCM32]|uniref:ATP-binding protein n=1 Tax=Rhodophyticola sp. CCM32 TaxID=2916397 RepID=UPI00107FC907|nr:ATP-binding protein [Rhodophyticola sp. CCM32]QBY01789.1 hypothetical protein E2K80_14545 [Rhodophyticola sp. CCM32]